MSHEQFRGTRVNEALAEIAATIQSRLLPMSPEERVQLCFHLLAVTEGISEGLGVAPLSTADEARIIARFERLMQAA